ncbi:hypothetical protein J2Z44_003780 [Clostridium punense]|uniref:DUF4367 domain-containing protein n=1 Tax=Clostridium punense TaxID=1054297 RepID=A0ABS4K836_9CLOT|nr:MULTISPECIES: DUF4367 domain-containing protein [Clostridium]EQB88779.1 hypothetical protein M918_23050 [Clostridium sp. BL8]MBP2023935.1 hypothetical protein [Clostridium punense]
MDNKIDIDIMTYLIGEEDAVMELDKVTEVHEFSEKYKHEKIDIIKRQSNIETINLTNSKGSRMKKKKIIVLIAAAVATLAFSVTAYGICKKFLVTTSRDEDLGVVTYEVQSEKKINKIPLINITPEYLPESYLPIANAPGKYGPNGDASSEKGIIMYQNDYIYQNTKGCISGIEESTIGGVKANIYTSEGMHYKYSIDLIYEEDGQIITVGGGISLEELKKVAENIKYELVPGEFLELYNPKVETSNDDVYIAPPVPADHVFNMNEKINMDVSGRERLEFTVDKVEIMDKLPKIDENSFFEYNEYVEQLNEDGTLKDYERSVSIKWENNKLNQVTKTAKRKFAYVTLTLRNLIDKEVKDVGVHPMIQYRMKQSDGTLKAFVNDIRGGNDIANSKEPIYFDQSDYPGGHFFFCDLKPNETKQVHLIYLLDEDYLDYAYISDKGMSIQGNGNEYINNFGSYVKIK